MAAPTRARLFENDPDSAPKPRRAFADDVVGRARSGFQINGRPSSLEKWRMTTGDPEVADAVHKLLGGKDGPQEWEAKGEDNLEVFTDAPALEILLDGPKSVRSEMVLYGRPGKPPIRRCDGVSQSGEGNEGKPCACPSSYGERKEAAKAGHGCEPSVAIFFRLAGDPDLGVWKFQSGSWSLMREIGPALDELDALDGPARAKLSLEEVRFTPKGKTTEVRFMKPVLEILGAAPARESLEVPY